MNDLKCVIISTSAVSLALFHPFFLSSYIFSFFSTSHFSATACAALCIYSILSPTFSLMSPPPHAFLPHSLLIQPS